MNTSYITPELIAQAGVELPADKVAEFIEHLNGELEERVGEEITNALDDDKLEELVKLQETADDATLAEWLNENVEDLQAIIDDELDILMGEVSEHADAFATE